MVLKTTVMPCRKNSFRTVREVCLTLVLSVAGAFAASQADSGSGAAVRQGAQVQGVAHLRIVIDGQRVRAELVAPAATLVGFAHVPSTAIETERLRLAGENLKAGDGMVRFNTSAGCRLLEAKVDLDLPAPEAARTAQADIAAVYRFECARPRQLDSAALGLFVGFPALQRALVRYVIRREETVEEGRGAAELTRSNPVVNFVPF